MFARPHLVFGALAAAAMLSLGLPSPAWMLATALAQSLKDRSCSGKSDIPDDQQILGCSDAIKSASFAGKDLAAAFSNRGRAYHGKGDSQSRDRGYVIRPSQSMLAQPFRFTAASAAYFAKKENDHAIDDFTKSLALDPKNALPTMAGATRIRQRATTTMPSPIQRGDPARPQGRLSLQRPRRGVRDQGR